jgi:hypothetical protein
MGLLLLGFANIVYMVKTSAKNPSNNKNEGK